MERYICLDIGGTAIKYGLVDGEGTILVKDSMPTKTDGIVQSAVEIVEELRQHTKIHGICISTAGMVDPVEGEIIYSGPTIPNYQGTQWKKIMENRFQVPCEVENDVNCANLAEFISGASKGSDTSVMLTVGTGIGGSMILHGELYRGFTNSAFEIGYMYMEGGSFQELGAASVLTGKVAARKQETEALWPGTRIFEEAKQGDIICRQAIEEMTEVLGKGIANICYVVNPQVVVLGGGIMAQETYLKDKLERAVTRHLPPVIAQHTKIVFAKHGNDAGMLGAFYHFCRCRSTKAE